MPALGSESSRGPTPRTFTLACLGDVMIAGSALEALRRMGAQSMTSRLWGAVSGADAVLANLESPVTDAPLVKQDKRYNFKCPDEVLSLFDSRFVLGLANNHIMEAVP